MAAHRPQQQAGARVPKLKIRTEPHPPAGEHHQHPARHEGSEPDAGEACGRGLVVVFIG